MKNTNPLKRILSILLTFSLILGIINVSAETVDNSKKEVENPIDIIEDSELTESDITEDVYDENLESSESGIPEDINVEDSKLPELDVPETIDINNLKLSAADIPEAINYDIISNSNHVSRLREQEDSLNTVVFQNDDNTNTMYVFSEPVKFVAEDGSVKDKSNELYNVSKSDIFSKKYAYVNLDNDIKTYFPHKFDKETGIMLTDGSINIELIPNVDDFATVRNRSTERRSIESCSSDDNWVWYDGVFGDNTTLRYAPLFEGFKEEIVLYKNVGNEFSFILKANGLVAELDESQINLIDPETRDTVFKVSPIYVYDSEFRFTLDNEMKLTLLEDGDYEIQVIVDEGFLSNPDTIYPVYIDPPITKEFSVRPGVNGAANNAIQDLSITSSTSTALDATFTVAGYSSSNSWRTIMRFPGVMSELSNIPVNNIQKAQLNLYTISSALTSSASYIDAYYFTGNSNWVESAINNNLASNSYSLYSGSVGSVYTIGGEVGIDITSAVKKWKGTDTASITSKNQGLLLKNSNEGNGNYAKIFNSRESSEYRPIVYVTYIPQYTVNFNANGGSVSPTSKIVDGGSTIGTLPTPTRTSPTLTYNANGGSVSPTSANVSWGFKGWYTAASGGTQVTANTAITANTTIYAQWNNPTVGTLPTPTRTSTITYNANGGSVSPTSANVSWGFKGWYTAATGGTQVTSNTAISANTTIYAQWNNPTVGTLPIPTRTGFSFNGWFNTSATTGGTQTTANTTVTANMTIYARWSSFDVPIPLTLNTYESVNINLGNQKQYFSFTPATTGFYTIESSSNTGDPYGRLYNINQAQLTYNDDGAGSLNFRMIYHLTAGQKYIVEAGCYSTGVGTYSLRVTSTTNLDTMTSLSPSEVSTLLTTSGNSANVTVANQRKVFKFTAPTAGIYVFESFTNTGDPYGWLYNVNGSQIDYNDDGGGNLNFRISTNLTLGQTVYLVAGCYGSGTGSYSVGVTGVYTLGKDTYSFANFSDSDSSGGHCFGMSITSSAYYLRILNIANIGGNYINGLYALSSNSTVKAPICDYQAKQGSYSRGATVAGWSNNINSDWNAVVNYVQSGAYDDKGMLQIGYDGHAINFLRYSVVSGQPRIYAYDNNYPNVETYFYKDNATGKIHQVKPYSTSEITSYMALRDVSTYFNLVSEFNATLVIYANVGVISINGIVGSLMEGNFGPEGCVMYEIPENLDLVEIIPLIDNATFEYLGNAYSFGKISDDTIGEFTLSKTDNKSTSTKPNLKIRRGNNQ